jgi:hypothetical protein
MTLSTPNQSSICITLLARIVKDLAKNIFKFQKEQILNLIDGYEELPSNMFFLKTLAHKFVIIIVSYYHDFPHLFCDVINS